MSSNNTTILIFYYNQLGLDELPYKIGQFVLASTFNLIALTVLIRMKKFTYSNVLFIMLCASDLTIGLVYTPLVAINMIYLSWPLGNVVCILYSIMAYSQFVVSNNLIFLMTIHRYLLLNRPFDTEETVTKNKILLIALFCLAPYVYMGISVLVHVLWNRFDFQRCAFDFSFNYAIIQDTLFYLMPSFMLVSLNVYNIFCLVIRNSRKQKMTGMKRNQVYSNENSSAEKKFKARCKESRKKTSLKAVLCILFIVINIFITEYPYVILWPISIDWIKDAAIEINLFRYYYLVLRLLNCFPIVNPIILLLFNSSFKKNFMKFFKNIYHRCRKQSP